MTQDRLLELPRKLCSSEYQWDSMWTSTVVLISSRDLPLHHIQQQCQSSWSPGMVLFLSSPGIDTSLLTTLASQLAEKSKQLGKARRIACGTPISRSLARELYKAFHCVEFVSLEGKAVIVDDGDERVVQAEIVVTEPN